MPVLFLGFLVGLIVSAFVSVASAVGSVLAVVVPIFVQVFGVVRRAVVDIAVGSGRFFRSIVDATRALYNNVLAPIVDAAQRHYNRFKAFLTRTFDPIIKIFDKVQDVMTWIWDRVIEPILDTIDKVRAALRLLGKLGVPFVDKIEAVLQQIQRTIIERFRQVQNWVNRATFWLDILLDPRGWIKSTPFLYTVWRYGGNILNIVTKFADRDGFARASVELERERNIPKDVVVLIDRFKAGDIRDGAAVQSAAARFRSRVSGRVA